MKKILALVMLTAIFSSCEKDDICTDDTTPRLILEFYDITNNANLKSVVNLKVKAEGASDFIVFNTALAENDPVRYLYSGNKIQLPLRTDGTTTKYSLILNSMSSANINEDFLEFNYTPENVFVSRACGYKTIFELNNIDGVIKSDITNPENFWIQDYTVLTTNIENENETHIKIYF